MIYCKMLVDPLQMVRLQTHTDLLYKTVNKSNIKQTEKTKRTIEKGRGFLLKLSKRDDCYTKRQSERVERGGRQREGQTDRQTEGK